MINIIAKKATTAEITATSRFDVSIEKGLPFNQTTMLLKNRESKRQNMAMVAITIPTNRFQFVLYIAFPSRSIMAILPVLPPEVYNFM
ncbi:MAG: hypothetical protein GX594_13190 [Pirellulaceae bacterium]|nr:hypothetical protein [Pirellulaceae bacterium]